MNAPLSRGILGFAALAGMAAAFALGLSAGRHAVASPRQALLARIPGDPLPAATHADGPAAFTYCLPCHRPDGQGIPGVFPPLVGSARLLGDGRIAAAIALNGLDSQGDPQAPRWGGRMVGLPQLPDEALAAALNHARNAWGNHAGVITAGMIAAVRAQGSGRMTPWTPAELDRTFPVDHPAPR